VELCSVRFKFPVAKRERTAANILRLALSIVVSFIAVSENGRLLDKFQDGQKDTIIRTLASCLPHWVIPWQLY
jgi:hypothetical protein